MKPPFCVARAYTRDGALIATHSRRSESSRFPGVRWARGLQFSILFLGASLSNVITAPYTFSVGNQTPAQKFFVQGQSFTPLVQGNVASATPAWAENGEVRLTGFKFSFAPAQGLSTVLHIYDRLPTPAEVAANGAGSIATGQRLPDLSFAFASVPLQVKRRYFAILPQAATIFDAAGSYQGGADLFISGGQFVEGGFDVGFTATFESTPYFDPAPPGPPPPILGLAPFYRKYLDAAGVPVVSSERVPDVALYVVRETVLRMVTKRRDVLAALITSHSRVGIMSVNEVTTDIPEHSDLYTVFPGTDWNTRARGLGATLQRPISTCAEENVLHYASDPYLGEDVLVHEFTHGIDLTGLRVADGQWAPRLAQAYSNAIRLGLWNNTYAASNQEEYLAEGVQSFFDVNLEAIPSNGIHNFVNTRVELAGYDPDLYNLIREVFPVELVGAERQIALTIERDSEQARLRWGTRPSVVYDLQFSSDLRDWEFVGLPIIGNAKVNFVELVQPATRTGLGAFRLVGR